MNDRDLQNYAVELGNQALQDYEFIAVAENYEELTNEECIQVHDLITKRVKAHIPTVPQIIHTVEELEALDPETVFMNNWGDLFDVNNVQAGINTEDFPYYFPCSVVATGAQVRVAREAMEEEDA